MIKRVYGSEIFLEADMILMGLYCCRLFET